MNYARKRNTAVLYAGLARIKLWEKQRRNEKTRNYPIEFNNDFKERIREKFDRKCFLCGMPEIYNGNKLGVHHVDYNKNNMDENNFITCCISCHMKTNGDRVYWQKAITQKLNG